MPRYKIVAFPIRPDGYRARKPLAYHVELPTLQDAIKQADMLGPDQAISIYSVSKEIPQIKGVIEWIPAARRVTDHFWMLSKQPNNKAGAKHENV